MVYTILDLPTIRHLLLLLHHASSPVPPLASFHSRPKSPPNFSVALGVALFLSASARPIRESGYRPAPVGTCIRGPVMLELSVCFATYSYYMHLFGLPLLARTPASIPVFLTAVHRTVTYYSHVTCSGFTHVPIVIHMVFVPRLSLSIPILLSPPAPSPPSWISFPCLRWRFTVQH